MLIPINQITVSKKNARSKIDRKSLKTLAESIQHTGLINPVTVEKDKNGYTLLAGKRRYLAVKEVLKKDQIEAHVHEDLSEEERVAIIYSENLERANLTIREELKQIEFCTMKKMKVQDIADRMGKSAAWVIQRRKLKDLIPEFLKVIDAPACSRITLDNWATVAALPDDQQERLAESWRYLFDDTDTYLNWEDFSSEIQEWNKLLKNAPWPLNWKCGELVQCTKCPDRTGAMIDLFSGDADLSKDRCLNSDCWDKKYKAYADKKLEELNTQFPNAIQAVSTYKFSAGKTIPEIVLNHQIDDEFKSSTPKTGMVPVIDEDKLAVTYIDESEYKRFMKNSGQATEPTEPKPKSYADRLDSLGRKWLSHAFKAFTDFFQSEECEMHLETALDVDQAMLLLIAFGEDYGWIAKHGKSKFDELRDQEALRVRDILDTGCYRNAAVMMTSVNMNTAKINECIRSMLDLAEWVNLDRKIINNILSDALTKDHQPKSWTNLEDYSEDAYNELRSLFLDPDWSDDNEAPE